MHFTSEFAVIVLSKCVGVCVCVYYACICSKGVCYFQTFCIFLRFLNVWFFWDHLPFWWFCIWNYWMVVISAGLSFWCLCYFFFCERLSCWCFCSFWHVNCWMLTFSPTLRHFEVCKFLEYLNCLRAITILMFSRFLMSFIFLRAITSLVFLRFSWIFPFLRVAILVFLRFLNFVFFREQPPFWCFCGF